jgi:hypothetical protein
MVLSIIFLEDKYNILLHLFILYEYQQFFQHRICLFDDFNHFQLARVNQLLQITYGQSAHFSRLRFLVSIARAS